MQILLFGQEATRKFGQMKYIHVYTYYILYMHNHNLFFSVDELNLPHSQKIFFFPISGQEVGTSFQSS